jgi:hypothetical protein
MGTTEGGTSLRGMKKSLTKGTILELYLQGCFDIFHLKNECVFSTCLTDVLWCPEHRNLHLHPSVPSFLPFQNSENINEVLLLVSKAVQVLESTVGDEVHSRPSLVGVVSCKGLQIW